MIFYDSPRTHGRQPSLRTLRSLGLVSLLAYPAGCLILAFGGTGEGGIHAHEAIGLLLLAVSLIAAAPMLGSRLQRIVGDSAKQLDEMELALRHRATSWAYFCFTALVCLAIFYAGVASDTGLWLPTTFQHFNALFWGVFLYSSLLPSTFLAWTLDPADEVEE